MARPSASGQRARAMAVMEDMLQAHRDLRGVFGINDDSALGALAVLEAASRTDWSSSASMRRRRRRRRFGEAALSRRTSRNTRTRLASRRCGRLPITWPGGRSRRSSRSP